jgi:hypothetical protein
MTQPLMAAHLLGQSPPQSTSVSFPFLMPSVQVACSPRHSGVEAGSVTAPGQLQRLHALRAQAGWRRGAPAHDQQREAPAHCLAHLVAGVVAVALAACAVAGQHAPLCRLTLVGAGPAAVDVGFVAVLHVVAAGWRGVLLHGGGNWRRPRACVAVVYWIDSFPGGPCCICRLVCTEVTSAASKVAGPAQLPANTPESMICFGAAQSPASVPLLPCTRPPGPW